MAQRLIESLTLAFDPAKYRDTYRHNLRALIDSKIRGEESKPGIKQNGYGAIAFFTLVGIAMNFLGVNPMKALVVAGIVQGFSTSPLMLLIMLMINNSQTTAISWATR